MKYYDPYYAVKLECLKLAREHLWANYMAGSDIVAMPDPASIVSAAEQYLKFVTVEEDISTPIRRVQITGDI